MEEIEPNPTPVRVFFFLSGIIATLAYRAIIVINFISPLLVQFFWYTGTILAPLPRTKKAGQSCRKV